MATILNYRKKKFVYLIEKTVNVCSPVTVCQKQKANMYYICHKVITSSTFMNINTLLFAMITVMPSVFFVCVTVFQF